MSKKLRVALLAYLLVAPSCSALRFSPPPSVSSGGVSSALSEDLLAFQNALIQDEVTGSNVALVVKGGERIYHEVVNSGKAGDRDITEDTLFPIWSMSKPVTIVAMMTLHEKGLFQWDEPVSKYIPCFANLMVQDGASLRPAKEPLRISHLMSHRSGYRYYALAYAPTPAEPVPPAYDAPHPNQTRFNDLKEFCEVAARQPLEFDPGSDFVYGINQAILGRLVEVLSGESFADYLEQALFGPLGMSRTSFVLDGERRSLLQPLFINSGELKGYTVMLNELTYTPKSRAHFGGEGLVSCLEDYARFCEMLVGGGVFRGRRVLSEESIKEMTAPRSVDVFAEEAPGFDMGFSVFVLREPALDGSRSPKGIYGWSGYHNTHFWVDPQTKLYALFMSRAREFSFSIPREMRAAVYGAH